MPSPGAPRTLPFTYVEHRTPVNKVGGWQRWKGIGYKELSLLLCCDGSTETNNALRVQCYTDQNSLLPPHPGPLSSLHEIHSH